MNKPSKFKKVIGYTRSSIVYKGKSKEEKEKPLEDIKHEFQIAKIKEFAGDKPCLIFSESDISRDTPLEDCPQLVEALNALKKDDVFVFWRLDRLLAGAFKLYEVTQMIGSKRAHIMSLTEPDIFKDDEDAKFYLELQAMLAQREIRVLRKRVKEKLSFKKKNGYRTGGIPYGYSVDSEKRIIINESEKEIVHLMLDLKYRKFMTYQEIANELNKSGIPKRSGCAWEQSAVFRILRNLERHHEQFPDHLQIATPQQSQFLPVGP